MPKNIFSKQLILKMSWEDAFNVAKKCFTNAERLSTVADILLDAKYYEQSFNNLFIASEEYFKAKSFNGISFIKQQKGKLKESRLEEFVNMCSKHEWKFKEAFLDAQENIPNITFVVPDDIDDTEIQQNLHLTMESIFEDIDKINPFGQKNNSLYVGYDHNSNLILSPQEIITRELVEKFSQVCFYIKMNCGIQKDSSNPSGNVGLILKWRE